MTCSIFYKYLYYMDSKSEKAKLQQKNLGNAIYNIQNFVELLLESLKFQKDGKIETYS